MPNLSVGDMISNSKNILMLKELGSLLNEKEIILPDRQKQQLISYVNLLDKWNKTYNLTSVHDPQQILIRHIMDSIVIKPYLQGSRFIDVGSGAGLPGIPLAIVCPDAHFTLLDSLGKRVRFLRQVQHELKITNIEPIQSRVKSFIANPLFDGVISRAFASLQDMLSWCHHLVNKQHEGRFYALKGLKPNDELANLPAGITTELIVKLQIPNLPEARHLVILK